MINIVINNDIIEKHKNYIKEQNISKKIDEELLNLTYQKDLKREKRGNFLKEHIAFCTFSKHEIDRLDQENDNLFLGKVEYLANVIEKVKKHYNNVQQYILEKPGYSGKILKVMGYKKFAASCEVKNKNMTYTINNFTTDEKDFGWGAYAYVMNLGMRVCPYCNRNYITPIYSHNGKARAELDHFFSKARYPYLSLSIYNLVPACAYCNSSLKGSEEFTYSNNFHPMDAIQARELYRMTYMPQNIDCFWGGEEYDIEIEYNHDKIGWETIKKNHEVFKIKELYQYHKDLVSHILKKRYIYDEAYINYLWNSYPNLFKNKEEVVEFLIIPYDNFTVENIPLGKLLVDLQEELFPEIQYHQ